MSEIVFGHLPTKCVHDTLMRMRREVPDAASAVIRSIDSIHSMKDLSCALTYYNVPHTLSSGNVSLRMDSLWRVVDAEIFTGFDEVWIFRDNLPSTTLYDVACATSDATDFSHGLPTDLKDAMQQTGCLLVLGDGCGLNYATDDVHIAETIADVGEVT